MRQQNESLFSTSQKGEPPKAAGGAVRRLLVQSQGRAIVDALKSIVAESHDIGRTQNHVEMGHFHVGNDSMLDGNEPKTHVGVWMRVGCSPE